MKTEKLAAVLRGTEHVWIVVQDYPDPDAIAAAAAFRELVQQRYSLTATMLFGGVVGRVENRALLKYLDLSIRPFDSAGIGDNDRIALLDTQPGTGNNCLPENLTPHVVIDHHPIRAATRRVAFTDIRRRYGATSTIMYEYLQEAKLPLNTPLATALLYGIRSDTQDLGRESTHADLAATLALFPLANVRMYHNIRQASLATGYYRLLKIALEKTWQCGASLASLPGQIDTPDAIGEIADLLLRHEKCQWALCTGMFEDRYLLSLRTNAPKADAGKIMQRLVAGRGTGGGHRMMAGGQIILKDTPPARNQKLEHDIMQRFMRFTAGVNKTAKPFLKN